MNARTGRWFNMRGAVLSVEDLETVDWPRLAHEHGINTLGTHITPEQVRKFWLSDKGRKFQKDCRKYGIKVEHELHAMKTLLPRELFSLDSTMFRMNAEGRRVADFNCCATSQRALDTIAVSLSQPRISIAFTVKDPNALTDKILRDAAKDARRKAKALCTASGVKLGKLLDINYSWDTSRVQETIVCGECAPVAKNTFDLQPEELVVSDSVDFLWEIE